MSSRADALWARSFAGAADGSGEAGGSGDYDWLAEPEPEMQRYHETPLRSHALGPVQAPVEDAPALGSLSASLDFGDSARPGAGAIAPETGAAEPASGADPSGGGSVSGGAGASAGAAASGGLYTRPDASFPDFSGFSFVDLDFSNVLDIDIENTVALIQNILIDIDVGAGATLFIDSLDDLIPDQNLDFGDWDLGDLASLFGGDAAANGMFDPAALLDSFADLGGGPGAGFYADIDVETIVDVDIVNDITLLQNLVIDIDLEAGATVVFADGIEEALDALGVTVSVEPADAAGPTPEPGEPAGLEMGCA